jgi:hypothetical protein
VDLGRYFTVNQPSSFLQHRIIRFLMNIHIRPRAVYLSRHGESVYNTMQRIGGDSKLTAQGLEYARRLHAFMTQCGAWRAHVPFPIRARARG